MHRLALLFALPALAGAEPRAGLWEFSSQMQHNGQAMPDMQQMLEQLQNLPPEQRQMMEGMLAQQGVKLGGGGVSVAHLVNNNAAWDNTLHGFTENSNTGAILLNRNTAYANKESGFYFATGKARLARNLAVGNGAGKAKLGSRTVSAANNWDGGVATPAFRSTDAATASTARRTDGSLPVTTFLTTGSKAIGATMN